LNTTPFGQHDSVEGVALFLGQQLDLRRFQHTSVLASAPLTVAAGENGIAVLFRYGAVVLFGMQPGDISRFVAGIGELVSEPFGQPETETFDIRFDPDRPEGFDQGRICLRSFSMQALQIVADVLAKSTVLSHYEVELRKHFDRIEPLAESIREGRVSSARGRALLEHIGDSLMIESKMTGRIEVTEKPELIWDYPEYDRLYLRLEDEFELAERHAAIDRKLGLINRTAHTLLDLLHNRRSLRVEWYIVILIVVDIVISLTGKLA
jgi:uncharacterized Rmd1/YagE family protein